MTQVAKSSEDNTLVALVVHEFYSSGSSGYLGRTAMQKLCYFAKALAVPFSASFQIYYYGPYSEDVASVIDTLVETSVIEDVSPDRSNYSNFKPGPEMDRVLTEHPDLIEQYRPTIREVVRMFGRLGPSSLELMSTIHFIDQKLRAAGSPIPEEASVVREFREVKGDKYPASEIARAYQEMRAVGLVGANGRHSYAH